MSIDINENLNISGGGINVAQRVMDCGDAGHILLSKRVADDLRQLSRWAKDLHDLGEAVVKHEERVHIYNLYNDEIGNSEAPAKLRGPEPLSKPRTNQIKRWLVVAAAVIVIGGALFWPRSLWRAGQPTTQNSVTVTDAGPPRVFTYFLTPSDKKNAEDRVSQTGDPAAKLLL